MIMAKPGMETPPLPPLQGKGPFESTELGTPSLKEGTSTRTAVRVTRRAFLHPSQNRGLLEAPDNEFSALPQRHLESNSIHGQPVGPAMDLESGRPGVQILHCHL